MKTLNFYHQKRKDGGIRTGVEMNGERVLELFKPGDKPIDSALEWFVDVRWRGQRFPSTLEALRDWLLGQMPLIQKQLQQMADELTMGIDAGWPLVRDFPTGSSGGSVKIVCSALRRLTGRDIRQVLLGLKKSWPQLIDSLPQFSENIAA